MSRRISSKVPLFIFLIVAAIVAAGGYILFRDFTGPEITLAPELERVAPATPLTVGLSDQGSGLRSVSIQVRRAGRIIPVLSQEFAEPEKQAEIIFDLRETGLADTSFDLEIKAVDASFAGFGKGNSSTRTFAMRMDSTPPRLNMKSSTPYVRRGGAGAVVYSSNKALKKTGVMVGDRFFPAYPTPDGSYVCFFAFPYNVETKDFQPQLVAEDLAGNVRESSVQVYRINRKFKTDTIAVEGFLKLKADDFAEMLPGQMTDIERFLKINGPMRQDNAKTLMQIGQASAPEALWQDAFLRLPNAAERAGFADHRAYTWEGEKVDEQTHLGYDLASLRQAQVPAGNSGVVVYADFLGIYGNVVIIDHGYGLQSLYSHLSEILVEKGQAVKRGDIIGRTGNTGMAVGDHLHFGILVSGMEVSPTEWLDPHWIKDNIADRLNAAGLEKKFLTEEPAPAPKAPGKKTNRK